MSIGPPQASSIRTSRSDGKSRRSPAAARCTIPVSVKAAPDPAAEPGPTTAPAERHPAVRRRPQVVQREPPVGHALTTGPADLRQSLRNRLGQDDVARPGHEPPTERRPARGPGIHGQRPPSARPPRRRRPPTWCARGPGRPARPAAARRPPAPTAPSQPGRSPSSSTAGRPRGSSRRARAGRAGARGPGSPAGPWPRPRMKTPPRKTGDATRARTSAAVSATYSSPTPRARHASTASRPRPVLRRRGADRQRARLRVPGVDAVRPAPRPDLVDGRVDRPGHRQRALCAVAFDERRQLVPPAGDEPTVAPRRPAAADVGLEEHDPRAGRELGQPPGGPQPGVPAADDDDVRRACSRAAAVRPRPGRRPRPPAPRAATTTAGHRSAGRRRARLSSRDREEASRPGRPRSPASARARAS